MENMNFVRFIFHTYFFLFFLTPYLLITVYHNHAAIHGGCEHASFEVSYIILFKKNILNNTVLYFIKYDFMSRCSSSEDTTESSALLPQVKLLKVCSFI